MLAGRLHISIESLCLVVIAGIALYSGWVCLDAQSDAEVLAGTRALPIPLLSGAVHYAVGRGIGHDHKEEEGFPELAAFLSGAISVIPREAYPAADTYPETGGHYLNMHYYLIGYLGLVFRVLGISVWSFRVACLLLHVATMLLLYGIFRLMMGRALSLLFAAYLATSQVYLFMLPELRDYGKVPFLLGALLMTGIILKHARAPRRLYVIAFFLGAVIGVGYGFRQDVFICLPLALFCTLVGAKVTGERVFLTRASACIVMVLSFSLLAVPVFKGNREVGNTITAHTLFQGMMVCAEQNAQFGSISYDSGFYNYDHPIIARIRAYAKRIGEHRAVEDLTPEYGRIGMRRVRDILCARPADFIGRVVAVADSLHGVADAPIIRGSETLKPGRDPAGREPLVPMAIQRKVASFFRAFGYMITAVTLGVVAASSLGTAFFMALFLGYLSAYTSTLFEFRHYFYLAFIPYFFAGVLVTRAKESFGGFRRGRKESGFTGVAKVFLKASLKGASFVGVLILCILVPLGITRAVQKDHWAGLLDAYDKADLVKVDVEERRDGKCVQWLLKTSIPEMQGIETLRKSDVAAAYLAVKFRSGERTVNLHLLNRNSIFARPFNVSLQDGGILFFPVYDFQYDPPFTFQGIEFDMDDGAYFEGLYWFPGADKMRLWPCVYVPQERSAFEPLKKGRIDRQLSLIVAELKGGLGLWPRKALDAYEELVKRHPFYAPFARRVLHHAARVENEEARVSAWKLVGSYMPHWRARCAQMIAEQAERSLHEKNPAGAIRMYETACEVEPDEVRYLQIMAEMHESVGHKKEARDSYLRLLLKSPEDGGAAYRLFTLDGEVGWQEKSILFWEDLGKTYPDSGVPWLYLGITLEDCGEWPGAVAAYARVPDDTPVYPRAVLRQGALNLRLGETEKGVEQLFEARCLDPALQGRILDTTRSAAVQKEQDHDTAGYLRLCEYLVELAPDEPEARFMLAEACGMNGKEGRAEALYKAILLENPDYAEAARQLDAIHNRRWLNAFSDAADRTPDAAVLLFWDSMIAGYPDKDLPRLYRGIWYERYGMLEEARLAYLEALEANPENGEASYRLGGVELLRGNIHQGMEMLNRCVQEHPGLRNDMKKYGLALAYGAAASQCYETSLCLFRFIHEVFPDDLLVQARLGDLWETVRDLDAARSFYHGLIMKYPDSAVIAKRLDNLLAYSGLDINSRAEEWGILARDNPDSLVPLIHWGVNLLDAGELDNAEKAFLKAREMDPEHPEVLRHLGIIKIQQGEVDAGIAMVQDAVRMDGEFRHAISRQLGTLALDRVTRKEYGVASRLYGAALEISPEDLWPKVRLGELMEITGDLEGALAYYREVLAVAPESPVTAANMDRLLRRKEKDNAVLLAQWRAIAERHPDAAVPTLYLGMALEATGDRQGALAAYRRVLEINPGLVEARTRLDVLEGQGLKR